MDYSVSGVNLINLNLFAKQTHILHSFQYYILLLQCNEIFLN